jgi:hypothetical protein
VAEIFLQRINPIELRFNVGTRAEGPPQEPNPGAPLAPPPRRITGCGNVCNVNTQLEVGKNLCYELRGKGLKNTLGFIGSKHSQTTAL